jgi:hypothetical protein
MISSAEGSRPKITTNTHPHGTKSSSVESLERLLVVLIDLWSGAMVTGKNGVQVPVVRARDIGVAEGEPPFSKSCHEREEELLQVAVEGLQGREIVNARKGRGGRVNRDPCTAAVPDSSTYAYTCPDCHGVGPKSRHEDLTSYRPRLEGSHFQRHQGVCRRQLCISLYLANKRMPDMVEEQSSILVLLLVSVYHDSSTASNLMSSHSPDNYNGDIVPKLD